MSKIRTFGLAAAAIALILDQIVKYFVIRAFEPLGFGSITITSFFSFTLTTNPGVSMGYLPASSDLMRWGLVALTAAISLAVLVWMWREKNRADVIALGLVLGGALGNITDRIRFGHVIDYADLHFGEWRPFYIFNLGDAAITIGVLILLGRALFVRDKKSVSENANA